MLWNQQNQNQIVYIEFRYGWARVLAVCVCFIFRFIAQFDEGIWCCWAFVIFSHFFFLISFSVSLHFIFWYCSLLWLNVLWNRKKNELGMPNIHKTMTFASFRMMDFCVLPNFFFFFLFSASSFFVFIIISFVWYSVVRNAKPLPSQAKIFLHFA